MNKIIFVFTMSMLLMVFLTGCGEDSMAKMTEELALAKFESSFVNDVGSIAYDFGYTRIVEYYIPIGYDEVCFSMDGMVTLKSSKEHHSFNVELMRIDEDFCVKTLDYGLKLRIEGKGDHAQVSLG
ncbi:hypothetical protein KY328_03860 [Candidatus Woesearchaeota archaeon]|nr:hypothetical protein [Candidatus Woesearchaeota archaeon]